MVSETKMIPPLSQVREDKTDGRPVLCFFLTGSNQFLFNAMFSEAMLLA